MKTKHLNRFLGFAFFMAMTFVGFAQNEVIRIKSKGTIIDYDTKKKLEGVQVIVMRNGAQQEVHDAGTSGKFDFTLPLGYTYDLKFSRADYVTKIIRVDTRNIPEEDRAGGFSMEFEASLFKYVEGFNTEILKEPMGKASFDSQTNYISFDFPYTEKMQKKVDEEFKRLKNLALDGDRMKKDFDKYMAAGEQRMTATRYQEAMEQFKLALGIFPNDELAKSRYAEAERLYKEQLNAKNDDENYTKLLKQGDAAFKDEKWEDAKTAYTEASNLRKNERYPKDQLYEIEKKLKALQDQAEYDALVAEGDKHFNDTHYEACIQSYENALKIYKNEAYPKAQIEKARAELEKLALDKARQEDIDRTYNGLVKEGDDLFNQKRYADCIAKYQSACDMKPTIAYPNNQITKARGLMNQSTALNNTVNKQPTQDPNLEKYNKLLTEANNLYAQSNLTNRTLLTDSRSKYNEASSLMPNEKLPKNQIKKIDELLSSLDNSNSHPENLRAERIAQQREYEQLQNQRSEEARSEVLTAKQEHLETLNAQIEERQQWEAQQRQSHPVQINVEAEANVESFYRDAAGITRKGEMDKINTESEAYQKQHLDNIGRNGGRVVMNDLPEAPETRTSERPTLSDISNTNKEREGYARKEDRRAIERAHSEADYRNQQNIDMKNRRIETREEQKTQVLSVEDKQNSFHNTNKSNARIDIKEAHKSAEDMQEKQRQRAIERQNQLEGNIMELNTKKQGYELLAIEQEKNDEISIINQGNQVAKEQVNEQYKEFTPKGGNSVQEDGVTERSFELTNPRRTVIERTVKSGKNQSVYQKIVSTNGILYTKDGTPISENIWNIETTSTK